MARPNVALIVETSVGYGRQILHGITRYLRTHDRWSIYLDERELLAPPPDWLMDWGGDGIICRSTTPEMAAALRGRAVVDLNDRFGYLHIPRIRSDMPAIGRLAAEHLRERGFRHIAYCGFRDEAWSQERLTGVIQALGGTAQVVSVFESPWAGLRQHSWQEERDRIAAWLADLPRPLGVVACNDVRGHHVLDACRALGVAVPDQIAVVGVDNTATYCELCDPPLSSVVPDADRIGYEAAALLDRLMDGRTSADIECDIRIPPRGVVTRQSTDVVAVEDPAIALAVRYIREHACEGIGVAEVVTATPLSRSSLERGFRRYLGRSPHEEIELVRLKRIKELLIDTDWSLARIAASAGFDHPEYMMVQFKRIVGQTPTEWRNSDKISQPVERISH